MDITFKTKDAEIFGPTAAMIISVIKDMPGEVVNIDGQWWVRATASDVNAFLPFLSDVTVKRVMVDLSKKGVIKKRKNLKSANDNANWFAISAPAKTKTKWIKSGVTVKV